MSDKHIWMIYGIIIGVILGTMFGARMMGNRLPAAGG